jgi:hypothetical protein
MSIRTRKMLTVVLETGSGTTLTLGPCKGDWTGPDRNEAGYVESIPAMDCGTYAEGLEGDDFFPTATIELYHDGAISGAAVTSASNMILHRAPYAADVTTDPGGNTWHLKARVAFSYSSAADGNSLSLTFTCYRTSGGGDPVVWA